MGEDTPELEALRRRLEAEEAAYAQLLGALDGLASFRLPLENRPDLPALAERLRALSAPLAPPAPGSGLKARFRRAVWALVAPHFEHQDQRQAVLLQWASGHFDEAARLHAHLREVVGTLVRYLQTVLPVMDARDRLSGALATTRAELVLEAFDRRQESLARRLTGLLALRDRLEAVGEEVAAVRQTLSAGEPPPEVGAAAEEAALDAGYVAFENRFRGDRDEIRGRLRDYLPLFEGLAPVVDLGCGRGEFLELLRDAGIAARGIEGNAQAVRTCRARSLDVAHGGLLAYLRTQPKASLGGVFAAQVAEHLPPPVLQAMLREAHRVLRPGGLMVLETVNPRSVTGLLEVFNRDLTHQKPLHPETLSFLAAAAGFGEVRVELRSPVEPAAQLQAVPADGLPERAASTLNENVARLNALLYGPQEYALLARR
ncbi:MAG TPA: methyltransferase domain-containing protein [Vicinamibacteria bacterium]